MDLFVGVTDGDWYEDGLLMWRDLHALFDRRAYCALHGCEL